MAALDKEVISVSYEGKDCAKGTEWLKAEILKDVEEGLNKLIINQPMQANFVLVYNANLNGSENEHNIKG